MEEIFAEYTCKVYVVLETYLYYNPFHDLCSVSFFSKHISMLQDTLQLP